MTELQTDFLNDSLYFPTFCDLIQFHYKFKSIKYYGLYNIAYICINVQ